MDEVKKPTSSGVSSVGSETNEAEVKLGDKTYKIYRLKAGKFYEALKVYMDMIKEVAPKTPEGQGESQVDFDKIIVSMFQSWPEKMVNFIVACCYKAKDGDNEVEITDEKIREESYPEQITVAFSTCLKLNRVGENLKNFAAPMGELGAMLPKAPNQG
jgi:hypothetical protein